MNPFGASLEPAIPPPVPAASMLDSPQERAFATLPAPSAMQVTGDTAAATTQSESATHRSDLLALDIDMVSGLVSFTIHVIVLLTLAMIGLPTDAGRPIALVIDSGTADELVDFESAAVEIPVHEPEVETADAAFDILQEPAELAFVESTELIGLASSAPDAWQGLPDQGFLLTSLGGGQGGGGTGGAGATFYGVRAKGRRFVFVTDCSGSMNGRPFNDLIRELHASIACLPHQAEFAVIFFNHQMIQSPELQMEPATSESKEAYMAWVNTIQPSGGTDPSDALSAAFKMRPSTIFLLTDGQFTADKTLGVIKKFNRAKRVQIHTIALGGQADADLLRKIAAQNRGELRVIDD